jgi:hypothetical protein
MNTDQTLIYAQALQNYLAQPQAHIKKSIEYFHPLYEHLFSLHHKHLSNPLNLILTLKTATLTLKINPQVNTYLHIHLQLKVQGIFSLQKTLSLLPKVNHEYIKMLMPLQINQAYLFNIFLSQSSQSSQNLQNQEQSIIIEHQLMHGMQKNNLEKWLWLLDYLLRQLDST